jgi:hypothetical protein
MTLGPWPVLDLLAGVAEASALAMARWLGIEPRLRWVRAESGNAFIPPPRRMPGPRSSVAFLQAIGQRPIWRARNARLGRSGRCRWPFGPRPVLDASGGKWQRRQPLGRRVGLKAPLCWVRAGKRIAFPRPCAPATSKSVRSCTKEASARPGGCGAPGPRAGRALALAFGATAGPGPMGREWQRRQPLPWEKWVGVEMPKRRVRAGSGNACVARPGTGRGLDHQCVHDGPKASARPGGRWPWPLGPRPALDPSGEGWQRCKPLPWRGGLGIEVPAPLRAGVSGKRDPSPPAAATPQPSLLPYPSRRSPSPPETPRSPRRHPRARGPRP